MILALVISFFFQFPPVTFEPIPSLTPVPSATPIGIDVTATLPIGTMIDYIATVQAQVDSVPEDVTNLGAPILPADDGGKIYAYTKWLVSPNIGDELFGPFGGFSLRLRNAISIVLAFAVIYGLLFFIIYLLRFVIYVVKLIRKLLPI